MTTILSLGTLILAVLAIARVRSRDRLLLVLLGLGLNAALLASIVSMSTWSSDDSSAVVALAKMFAVAELACLGGMLLGLDTWVMIAYGLPSLGFAAFCYSALALDERALRVAAAFFVAAYAIHLWMLAPDSDAIDRSLLFPLAAWFALGTSLVANVWRLVRLQLFSLLTVVQSNDALYLLPPESYWATPFADLIVFLATASVLALLGWLNPRLVPMRLAVFTFSWLASLNVFLLVLEFLPVSFCLIYALAFALGMEQRICAGFGSFQRFAARTLPVAAFAVVVLAFAALGGRMFREQRALDRLPAAKSATPNVLLIVMDTTRRESIGTYGYPRPTTPNLDRWGKRGVVFENAVSTSSWTLPSHASMFTGRWCHEHRAEFTRPLDGKFPTLAEALSHNGYETASFVVNSEVCGSHSGLARGFSYYRDHPRAMDLVGVGSILARIFIGPTWPMRPSADAFGELTEWIDDRHSKRPFFAFVNLRDSYYPYIVHDAAFDVFATMPAKQKARLREDWITAGTFFSTDPAEIQLAVDSYDGAVKYMDHHIGRTLDSLDERGILDSTLVIITHDHGEHFGERGLFLHGTSLYRQLIDAPLIVLFPKAMKLSGRVKNVVGLQNLPKTVLDVLGLDEERLFPGQSLVALCGIDGRSSGQWLDSPVFSQLGQAVNIQDQINSNGVVYSVIGDGYHYILSGSDGHEEIFDFWSDGKDAYNRIQDAAGQAAAAVLRDQLEQALNGPLESVGGAWAKGKALAVAFADRTASNASNNSVPRTNAERPREPTAVVPAGMERLGP